MLRIAKQKHYDGNVSLLYSHLSTVSVNIKQPIRHGVVIGEGGDSLVYPMHYGLV